MPATTLDRKKVLKKLRQWLYESDEKCRVITINHLGSKGPVQSFPINDQTDIEELASKIEDTILEDAKGLGRTQTYAMHAYFGKSTESGARATFAVYTTIADDYETPELGTSEPPTGQGITSMVMRHLETREKATMGTIVEVLRMLRNENDSIREKNEELLNKAVDNMKIYEELLDKKFERQLQLQDYERKAKAMDIAIQKGMGLLPAIAAKIAGLPAGAMGGGSPAPTQMGGGQPAANGGNGQQAPASDDLDTMAIREAFGQLDSGQRAAFMDILTNEQKAIFMDMLLYPTLANVKRLTDTIDAETQFPQIMQVVRQEQLPAILVILDKAMSLGNDAGNPQK